MKRKVTNGGITIEYTLVHTSSVSVRIRVPHPDSVVVSAPKQLSLKEVDAVVLRHFDEIVRILSDMHNSALKNGGVLLIEGRPHKVEFVTGKDGVYFDENIIRVSLMDTNDTERARSLVKNTLSKLALEKIKAAIEKYLPEIGGSVNKITIRDQRTRWGSCSRRGNLNFNWKLILAPHECLEYVVIHELCHLHEFNHSPAFWRLVENRMKDYKVWKDYLSKNAKMFNL